MKTQARLRLRRIGKHNGDPRPWLIRLSLVCKGYRTNLMRAFEMNCYPKHYADDQPPPSYRQMNYVTGRYNDVHMAAEFRSDTWEYWDAHNH